MSFIQVSKSLPDPSTKFSILDLKAQAVRLPISKGSQILLSELLTWSGEKGYCWWSIPKIAQDLNWSVSAVWRKATELKQSGLLEVIPRPGRSNYWVPLPGPVKMRRVQNELAPLATPRGPLEKKMEKSLKRCTVEESCASTDQAPPPPELHNVNAVKISPEKMSPLHQTTETPLEPVQSTLRKPIQQKPAFPVPVPKPKIQVPLTPDQMFLVEEVEQVTGDTWSRGHFVNLVRQTDEQTIYTALSVTREKGSLESGVNLGAYFTATVRGMTGLASLGARPMAGNMTPKPSHPHILLEPPVHQSSRLFHADEPEPEPLDLESLKRGWKLHYRGEGVQGMLSLVQRCVPVSVDVGRLWMDVRETFSGTDESVLIDRLLDTVVTRSRHAERMAEEAA